MEMPDIFADALRAKLQELQYGIISLHHSVISKEHEELLQEVGELRSRCLHDRASASHEPLHWKGTKALRHQENQQQQDDKCNGLSKDQPDDTLTEHSAQVEPSLISVAPAVISGSASPCMSEDDLARSPSASPSCPPKRKEHRQVSLKLNSIVPEAKAHASSSAEGSSAVAEAGASEGRHSRKAVIRSKHESSEAAPPPEVQKFRSEPERPVSRSGSERPLSRQGQEVEQRGAASLALTDTEFAPFNSERSRGFSGHSAGGLLMPGGRDSAGSACSWMSRTASGAKTQVFSSTMEALPIWQYAFEALQSQNRRWSHNSNWSFGSRPEDFHAAYDSEEEASDMHALEKILAVITVQPLSAKRICWDVFSFVFIAWDMFFIPLKLFHPPDWQIIMVMLWITRLFWTADLPISFLTGLLMNDGNIEMHPFCIARRYVRTWLFPDIAMVVCDWVELFIDADIDAPWRLIKLLRLYRLTRILKIPETLALIGERIWSEQVLLVANFIKIVGLVLGVAHLIACFWYGVSRIKSNGTSNWVFQHGFAEDGLFERYAMSFHWSLTQFVGGMDIVQPCNIWERIFAILVVLLTFIISAAVVSSITSSMTRLQFIAGNRSAQLSALRRYLMDHNISRKLMMRIQRNAEHAMTQRQRNVAEAKVELLQLISEPLRVELHFEEHSSVLSFHPFFELYTDLCPAGMRKVCHHAIATKVLWPGDVLFSNGETPTFPQMYFICSGSLQYQPHASNGCEVNTTKVHSGQWACEGTLWVRWIHRGMLRVTTESRVVTLSAALFQDITSHVSNNGFHPSFYAMEFVDHLASKGQLSDLGERAEVDLIMRYAYDRILKAQQDRRSSRRSTHHQRSSVRGSVNMSTADIKRALHDHDDHSFLGELKSTMSFVGYKMQDLASEVVSRVSHMPHHQRASKVDHLHNRMSTASCVSCVSCVSANPNASDSHGKGSDEIEDPCGSSSISIASPRDFDDSGAVGDFAPRFSFNVVEAGQHCPEGEPAPLAVQEFVSESQ